MEDVFQSGRHAAWFGGRNGVRPGRLQLGGSLTVQFNRRHDLRGGAPDARLVAAEDARLFVAGVVHGGGATQGCLLLR